jgi:hypothetical protein
MALLKRRNNGATVAALERELAQFEERKAALEAKLSEANSALVQATDARQVSLLESDLSDEQAAIRRDAAVRCPRSDRGSP